jgi:hypothetical protein
MFRVTKTCHVIARKTTYVESLCALAVNIFKLFNSCITNYVKSHYHSNKLHRHFIGEKNQIKQDMIV